MQAVLVFCLLTWIALARFASAYADDETKVYALYFPQFHPDEINNRLWKDNFTDWDNLLEAPRINRLGGKLPHPTELGYYNLLDHETRRKQRELAVEFGVDGFIYHHYYFYHEGWGATLAGSVEKLLLEGDGEPDLPFAFNWAKESWETTWHGKFSKHGPHSSNSSSVLVEQITPTPSDPRVEEHYNGFLRRFFHHKNYIKVNGAPLLTVYGSESLSPASLALLDRLRELAMQDGFPAPGLHVPLLRRMVAHALYFHDSPRGRQKYLLSKQEVQDDVLRHFDALAFYPFNDAPPRQMTPPEACTQRGERVAASVRVLHRKRGGGGEGESRAVEGDEAASEVTEGAMLPSYLGVNSVFDNTPRRSFKQAHIYDRNFTIPGGHSLSSTERSSLTPLTVPQSFALDLVTALMFDRCCQPEELREKGGKYLMVNAWNEWGEGMMLEPSDVYGRGLLEAVREAKRAARELQCDWSAYRQYKLRLYQSDSISNL